MNMNMKRMYILLLIASVIVTILNYSYVWTMGKADRHIEKALELSNVTKAIVLNSSLYTDIKIVGVTLKIHKHTKSTTPVTKIERYNTETETNPRASVCPSDTRPGTYEVKRPVNMQKTGTKKILVWNRPEDWWSFKTPEKHCQYKNCIFIDDKCELPRSDAVLFHAPDLQLNHALKKVPGQIFVFWTMEPPFLIFKNYNDRKWRHFFNWTMGYRRDADIYQPYVRFIPRGQNKPDVLLADISNVVRSKHKEIAWWVSHCSTESKRERYVHKLRKYMNVDIYGKCGPLKCESRAGRWKCLKMLNKYKFYLAFENSICRDYVTEKQLYTCYNKDNLIIPVTRGSPQSYLYKPPNSYIDTANFSTVKDLAEFLKQVASNETKYMDYFRLRRYFDTVQEFWGESACTLCRKLNNVDKYKALYGDIHKWTNEIAGRPVCEQHPTDL